MEWLLAGNQLQQCRSAFLPDFLSARSILLLGEGHGRFVRALAALPGERSILCVDQSRGMIEVARERLPEERGITFQCVDIFEFEPSGQFDAVATHFFLDCFTEAQLDRVIPKISGFVAEGGLWHLADFQIPTGFIRGLRARIVLRLAYLFFRVMTRLPARRIIPPQARLSASGWTRARRREFNFGLLYSELWRKSANPSDSLVPSQAVRSNVRE
jgi:SAM-dependent methyltransferase